MSEILLESVLVCPVCGFAKREKDADRRLPVFFRMRWLQDCAAPKAGRLLRLLFLRFGEVSPDAGRNCHSLCGWMIRSTEMEKLVTKNVKEAQWQLLRWIVRT